jgi:hypothetical protein
MTDNSDDDDPFGTLGITDETKTKELPIGLITPDPIPAELLETVEFVYRNSQAGGVLFVGTDETTGEEIFDDVTPEFGTSRNPETEQSKWCSRMGWTPGTEALALVTIAAVRRYQQYAHAVTNAELYWTLRRIREGKEKAKKGPLPPLAQPWKDLKDDE